MAIITAEAIRGMQKPSIHNSRNTFGTHKISFSVKTSYCCRFFGRKLYIFNIKRHDNVTVKQASINAISLFVINMLILDNFLVCYQNTKIRTNEKSIKIYLHQADLILAIYSEMFECRITFLAALSKFSKVSRGLNRLVKIDILHELTGYCH